MGFMIWDGKQGMTLPSGRYCDAEEIRRMYPVTQRGTALLEVLDGGVVGGIENLNDAAARYGVLPELSDEEKLAECAYEIVRHREPDYDVIEELLALIEGMSMGASTDDGEGA